MSVQTIETMVRWVDDHVLENPTLENMSAHVGYSPYYCSSKFREHTGTTYKQYLAGCRLRTAGHLLISTDDRITDIAHQCGLSSSEALSRAFVNAYDSTPSQYRKRMQTYGGVSYEYGNREK